MSFLNSIYKEYRDFIQASFFLSSMIIIYYWGELLGMNKGIDILPPSLAYVLIYIILFFVLAWPIFHTLKKRANYNEKLGAHQIKYILFILLLVMFIQFMETYMPIFFKRISLGQKNVVASEEVCESRVVYRSQSCHSFFDRSQFHYKDGCYSRLMPTYPLFKKCTQCLIICE